MVNKNPTITICCSASFYKEALGIEKELRKLGFKVKVPSTAKKMKKNNDFDTSHYKTWYKNKADYKKKTALMKNHINKIIKSDAILVLNLEKNGIAGYIGGNGLMEMLVAFLNKKPIFVYNQIPDNLNIAEEIYGLNSIFINQDLKVMSMRMKQK